MRKVRNCLKKLSINPTHKGRESCFTQNTKTLSFSLIAEIRNVNNGFVL